MHSDELRQKFLNFFEKKGHKVVSSSSLIPSDPSVLFTTAGMQQFSLYLMGEKDVLSDFGSRHLASCQKCFRSNDIEEIGDDTHHTFFEMLGNWSVGEDQKKGYFKKGAIKLALDFFINEAGLDKKRFWITVFKGNEKIKKDDEAIKIWMKNGIPRERIMEFGEKDNLWGPVGNSGPCGPNSEIHYDRGEEFGCKGSQCGPNCPNCKRYVELWNLVFMEYNKDEKGNFNLLPQKNVDTGIGFERLSAILQNKQSAFETDLFLPLIQELETLSGKKYEEKKKSFRIIADHARGAVFLIADGIFPSNVERGYILRRVLRRAIRFGRLLNLEKNFLLFLAKKTISIYKFVYPELKSKETEILGAIQSEEEKFERTVERGLREFNAYVKKSGEKIITGKVIFDLYQNYGFPLELTKELAEENGLETDDNGFTEEFKKHQAISKVGAEKKFGGVGKEATYDAAKLHTATHLLHASLRKTLGANVKQMGSDITSQRLRFDFSFPRKLTAEETKNIEDLVNQKIKEDLEVTMDKKSYEEAVRAGALAFFKEKYPPVVNVYAIGNFSKEICAGPHAKRTAELGRFKIIKDESSGTGVRRIRAILE